MPAMTDSPTLWLDAAREDERVAMTVADFAPGAAAFHWQQAIEKRLKAIMAAAEIDIPRAHDLVYLWNILAARDILPQPDRETAETLRRVSRLAVLGRYPLGEAAPSENVTQRDVAEAQTLARAMAELTDEVTQRLRHGSKEAQSRDPRPR